MQRLDPGHFRVRGQVLPPGRVGYPPQHAPIREVLGIQHLPLGAELAQGGLQGV